jgi:hypothetical protein
VFLTCVLGAFLHDVLWRERTDRLLVNAFLGKMRSGLLPERCVRRMEIRECSLSVLKVRSSVDLASVDLYRTNRPPCIGRGCRVRLVGAEYGPDTNQ